MKNFYEFAFGAGPRHLLAYLVTSFAVWAPCEVAKADSLSGAVGAHAPVKTATQSGAAVVHIAPPSAAGVSYNEFPHFNVGSAGLILNNSVAGTHTELAGKIDGNPRLGMQPARLIVNEVLSTSPSTLAGMIEVAGQRADVIVANPNGIHCDGCGFIHAGHATLTTGQPQFAADGALQGFQVRGGTLTIGPAGLDARTLQQLDLHARGIRVDGPVEAERIQAIAGINQIAAGAEGSEGVQARAALNDGGEAPQFAIDIGAVGGMHAGQVLLLATEKGVGVHSQGRLEAYDGSLRLSAQGDIRIEGSSASVEESETTTTGSWLPYTSQRNTKEKWVTEITPATVFGRQIHIRSGGDVRISAANLASENDLEITARGDLRIDSVASGAQTRSTEETWHLGPSHYRGAIFFLGVHAPYSSAIMTEQAPVVSKILSGGEIRAHAGGHILQRGAWLHAQGDLKMQAPHIAMEPASAVQSSDRFESEFKLGATVAPPGGSFGASFGKIIAQNRLSQKAVNPMAKGFREAHASMAATDAAGKLPSAIQSLSGFVERVARNPADVRDFMSFLSPKIGFALDLGKSDSQDTHSVLTRPVLRSGQTIELRAHQMTGSIRTSGADLAAANLRAEAAQIEFAAAHGQDVRAEQFSHLNALGNHEPIGSGRMDLEYSDIAGQSRKESDAPTPTQIQLEGAAELTASRDMVFLGATLAAEGVKLRSETLAITSLQTTSQAQATRSEVDYGLEIAHDISSGLNTVNARGEHAYAMAAQQAGISVRSGGLDIQASQGIQLTGGLLQSTGPADLSNVQTPRLQSHDLSNFSTSSSAMDLYGVTEDGTPVARRLLLQASGITQQADSQHSVTPALLRFELPDAGPGLTQPRSAGAPTDASLITVLPLPADPARVLLEQHQLDAATRNFSPQKFIGTYR